MSKTLFLLPFCALFLSSCVLTPAEEPEAPTGDDRTRDIRNIETDAYVGRVSNFRGLYEGECSGMVDGKALVDCMIEVEVLQSQENISVYYNVTAQEYGASFRLVDFEIRGNKIVNSYDNETVIGRIGSAGFKFDDFGRRVRFLLSSVRGFYLDIELSRFETGKISGNLSRVR